MKKGILVAVFVALVLICLISKVYAQDALQQAQQGLDTATTAGQQITNPGTSSSYLKEQWAKFFTETPLGKQIAVYLDYPKIADPVFKFVLGIEFSWTEIFFVTVFLWFLIGNYFKRLIDLTGIISKPLRWFLSLVSIVLVSFAGLTATLASWVVSAVNLVSWPFTLTLWIALFIAWAYLMSISGKIHKLFGKAEIEIEKKREMEKVKRDVEELKSKKDYSEL